MSNSSRKRPAMIGVPYEEGMYWRKGAKEGPAAIRKQLSRIGPFSLRLDTRLEWEIEEIDQGDIPLDHDSPARNLQAIEDRMLELLRKDRAPVVLGGDHSLTVSVIRALAKHLGARSFGVLHFDAHSDTFDPVEGYDLHHGETFRSIVEEGLVDPESIYQFGIRGQVWANGLSYANQTGIRYFSRDEFVAGACRLEAFGIPADQRYYVSIDIDVVDPAFAPGTGTPVPGGLTSSEMLQVVRQLGGLDLVGMDLVELSPVYDTNDITSLLAANIVFEMLAGTRWR